MFGEWYQKRNKTKDTNKLTLLAFKIIIILYNTRLATFIKLPEVNLFVSSVLFVLWYHSPNVLDTPHICNISRLRVKPKFYRLPRQWSLRGPFLAKENSHGRTVNRTRDLMVSSQSSDHQSSRLVTKQHVILYV
jgi:hypothetical protein